MLTAALRRHAGTASGIALALPVVSCGLLIVGFLVADALDFRWRRRNQHGH